MEQSVKDWVDNSPKDQVDLRRCIHITLHAIASDENLSKIMVLKGGILMAIKFANPRFTTDIDFSCANPEFRDTPEAFKRMLNRGFRRAEVELGYNLICQVQSIKLQPRDFEEATFPSFVIKIAYANKSSSSEMARFQRFESPRTISIDYSFNEYTGETSHITIDDAEVAAYTLESMLAEKYRSILQQEARNRNRRQDVFDIHHLLSNYATRSDAEKIIVLKCLLEKAKGKNINDFLHANALDDERIRTRSAQGFDQLDLETHVELSFEDTYAIVNQYFKELPWS